MNLSTVGAVIDAVLPFLDPLATVYGALTVLRINRDKLTPSRPRRTRGRHVA